MHRERGPFGPDIHMPLPHEDQDEEETVTQALDPPDAVVKRTKEVDSEVGSTFRLRRRPRLATSGHASCMAELSTALEDLLSKQKAYAASLSTIGDLLDKAAPDDADWLSSVADELNAWPSTSEEVRVPARPADCGTRLQSARVVRVGRHRVVPHLPPCVLSLLSARWSLGTSF